MLNNDELKTLQDIENKYYMKPILKAISADLRMGKIALQDCFKMLLESSIILPFSSIIDTAVAPV